MKITIPCARCGVGIEVDEQTINNAALLSVNLTVEHGEGECPTEVSMAPNQPVEVPKRRFRLQLSMYEIPADADEEAIDYPNPVYVPGEFDVELEPLAGAGHTSESINFPTAVNGPFTTWLNDTWPKLMENAALADLPASDPATPA